MVLLHLLYKESLRMKRSAHINPLDRQVEGSHYKDCSIQPLEYMMANNLDACQSNIVKYVTRFRAKNGRKDLEKAKHYIELLIQFEYGETLDEPKQREHHSSERSLHSDVCTEQGADELRGEEYPVRNRRTHLLTSTRSPERRRVLEPHNGKPRLYARSARDLGFRTDAPKCPSLKSE